MHVMPYREKKVPAGRIFGIVRPASGCPGGALLTLVTLRRTSSTAPVYDAHRASTSHRFRTCGRPLTPGLAADRPERTKKKHPKGLGPLAVPPSSSKLGSMGSRPPLAAALIQLRWCVQPMVAGAALQDDTAPRAWTAAWGKCFICRCNLSLIGRRRTERTSEGMRRKGRDRGSVCSMRPAGTSKLSPCETSEMCHETRQSGIGHE